MSKLRVGVIGVGGIATSQHLPHWHSCPNAELAAVADTNPYHLENAAKLFGVDKQFTDWRDLIEMPGLDIIDIATPNRYHAEMSIAALEAGMHVLCEKPMATTAADAEKMVETSRKANRLLMVNHVFRFSRPLEQMVALTSEGELGDVYYVRAVWNRRRMVPTSPTFVRKELSAGGPLLDIGVHMLDLACWVLGFPKVQRVTGTVGRYLAHQHHLTGEWGDWDHDAFDVEDFATTMVHFEGGITLSMEVSWLLFQQQPERRSLHVFGNRGGFHWPDGILCSERNKVPYDLRLVEAKEDNPFHTAIHRFAAAVAEGRPSPIPPEESLEVMQILDALSHASKTQQEVRLDSAGHIE